MSPSLPKASVYPFILCLALALTACGSGGGGSDKTPPQEDTTPPPVVNPLPVIIDEEEQAGETTIDLTGIWNVSISSQTKSLLALFGIDDPSATLAPGGKMIISDTLSQISVSQCLPPGSPYGFSMQMDFERNMSTPNDFVTDQSTSIILAGQTWDVIPSATVNNENSISLIINVVEIGPLPVDLRKSALANSMSIEADDFPASENVVCALARDTKKESGAIDLFLTTIFEDKFLFLSFTDIIDQQDDEAVNGSIANHIKLSSEPLFATYTVLGVGGGGIDILDAEADFFDASYNLQILNGNGSYSVRGRVEFEGFEALDL